MEIVLLAGKHEATRSILRLEDGVSNDPSKRRSRPLFGTLKRKSDQLMHLALLARSASADNLL